MIVQLANAAEPAPVKTVRYFPPFTTYEFADAVRVVSIAAAVCLALIVLLLAFRRWRENSRSSTAFLLGIATALVFESGLTSLLTLGRPPTWWLIAGRGLVIALSAVGCVFVVREANRGMWARRS